jgi:hypothetical protein
MSTLEVARISGAYSRLGRLIGWQRLMVGLYKGQTGVGVSSSTGQVNCGFRYNRFHGGYFQGEHRGQSDLQYRVQYLYRRHKRCLECPVFVN